MTDEVTPAEQATPIRRRSAWLSFIIILSFAGSGGGLLIAIASLIGGAFSSIFLKIPVIDAMLLDNLYGSWVYILIKILLYATSLTGVIFMWKLKRRGFWFYLDAQASLLIVPFIFLMEHGFAYLTDRLIVNVIFALFFIILYTLQLKNMD
jgi:hypothetical protein